MRESRIERADRTDSVVSGDKRLRGAAIQHLPAVALFLIVSAIAVLGDLLSKHYVFESFLNDPGLGEEIRKTERIYHRSFSPEQVLHHPDLRRHIQRRVLPGVQFTLSTNPGVVFGLRLPRMLVGAASLGALVLVLFLFATSGGRAWSVHVGLAVIMGGALGNLYDRLFSRVEIPGTGVIRGQVRDFIDCSELHYPYIFNVADALLVIGVSLLILHWWVARGKHDAQQDSNQSTR